DLARRQARLSDPRRHSDHAAGGSAPPGLTAGPARWRHARLRAGLRWLRCPHNALAAAAIPAAMRMGMKSQEGGREIVIKVWGRKASANVQKVMWAIGEIGLPHERIDIGGPFGKNREPAYLAMNPNGLVPTLEEEDGFLLWESNAIVRYLAAKH